MKFLITKTDDSDEDRPIVAEVATLTDEVFARLVHGLLEVDAECGDEGAPYDLYRDNEDGSRDHWGHVKAEIVNGVQMFEEGWARI